jgi:transcriptional regulator with XRE-family HTH domain
MEIQQRLGSQIKKAREARRWSQSELGRHCGVERAQISKLEKNVTEASMKVFLKICEALRFEIRLREQPETAKKPDFEEILSQLSSDKHAELEEKARTSLRGQGTPDFAIIAPALRAKMIELLEAESEQQEEEEEEEDRE